MMELMVVVTIINVVFAISAPNIRHAREVARGRSCIRNLRQIDGAKEQYAIDWRLPQGNTMPALSVLCGDGTTTYIKGGTPVCPRAGTYAINRVGTNPTCSVGTGALLAHQLP